MRISFVLPPVGMSGGVRVVGIYSRLLKDMGHDVVLVSPPGPDVSFKRKIRHFIAGKGWPRQSGQRSSHLDGMQLDHRVIDRFRPIVDADMPDGDVVIATWWETAEWVSALGGNKGAKVFFVQGHEVFPHLPLARVRKVYRLPLRKIVISKWLAEIMATEYADHSAILVPNAVDHSQFFASSPRQKNKQPTVGFLFQEAAFKGMGITLAALAKLRHRHPDLRAICFGSCLPSNRDVLPDWIEFYHSPPQDKLRDYYSACDVWITTSTSEGFNLPAMEAMACRTPVVSTATGWPIEAIVDRKNGVLVEINDVDGIVDGADWILGLDEVSWREVSEAAYATASENSWERSGQLFEAALAEIVSQGRHSFLG